jgi:putative hemolysin
MNNENENNLIEYVDVRKTFYNKNEKLARLLPGFFFRYLERIVHQKEINDFLSVHGHKKGIEFLKEVIKEFNVTYEIRGEDNLKKEGRYIFAGNHPLGGFDGMLLLYILSQYYTEVKFLVNDILMNIKNLSPLFIPINKHGGQSKDAAAELDKIFTSDSQVVTFPAGLVSRKVRGKIVDLKWHKNFITKAIKYKRDIIPVHTTGRNTNFFYNLANIRKFLGIKYNIEMLYLADETFKHRNKHIIVSFGEPIPYTNLNNSFSAEKWAEQIKQIVYNLDPYEI